MVGQQRGTERKARWSLNAQRTQQSAGLQGEGGHATRKEQGERGPQGKCIWVDQEKSEQLWYRDPDSSGLSFS